jgi:hypothetical protein
MATVLHNSTIQQAQKQGATDQKKNAIPVDCHVLEQKEQRSEELGKKRPAPTGLKEMRICT